MKPAYQHSTGLTIACTAALAVALSLAPLPEPLRPLPDLARIPVQRTLAQIFVPGAEGTTRPQEVMTSAPELPAQEKVPEEEAPPQVVEAPAEPEPPLQLAPAAMLGAPEARAIRQLERLAARVQARHVDLELGCREQGESGCTRRALDGFFDALEQLALGARSQPVRVVHLGDSLIASDHITDMIRRRLELRYGSAGPGFLFVDRPTRFSGRKVRTGEASETWEIAKLTDRPVPANVGVTGVRFTAVKGGERAEFAVGRARTAELFFLTEPKGGVLEARGDDQLLSRIFTQNEKAEVAFARVNLPTKVKRLRLTTRGPVEVYGVSLENGRPGVIYDSIGLPGGSAEVFLRADQRIFSSQLAHRAPSLVVLMLGGNEAYEIGRGWMKLEDARRQADALVRRIQEAVPGSDCLLISPMDAGVQTVGGAIEPRRYSAEVGRVVREVALERGCAYWDMLTAMGGEGSVPRWLDAGLMNSDLVHPYARGADLLGHLFDFALERARAGRRERDPLARNDPPGLEDAQPALARTFERLRALEAGRGERFAIVQLGASHTAAHMFTDQLRRRLSDKFGGAGRGYVAAGRPTLRLKPARVSRSLTGDWRVLDARALPAGEIWGLTGTRAEGGAGASMSMVFGEGEQGGTAPGKLSLYFLEAPGRGELEVRIDGKRVDTLRATGTERAARVVAWPVTGSSHILELRNAGPGPITVFGAALDLDKAGIAYDALGLPGSTAILADGYDKPALEEQLRARRADLYVLFWGTNESALEGLETDELREHNLSMLRTLRAAAPEADCLILGPTDRLERGPGGQWAEAPRIDDVIRTLREVARLEQCAFWSARAAMGGPRSMERWQQLDPPLGHGDGVHLTRAGYERLADALADELLAAWRSAPKEPGNGRADVLP